MRGYNDERIRYIRQAENIGPNNNYNACLNAAKGDYFLLLHDDDLIDHDLIKTCIEAANYSKKYGLIRTGTRMIDSDVKTIKEPPNIVENDTPEALFDAWLSGKASFYFCSTLFNTYGLREIGGLRSKNNLFEDGAAIIKLADKWPILNIAEAKASFRMHPDQRTSAQNVHDWFEDFRQAIDLIYLQNPERNDQLFLKGMHRLSRVCINFARRSKNPFDRAKAFLYVAKFFPFKYWPNRTWKMFILGIIGYVIYGERKPSN